MNEHQDPNSDEISALLGRARRNGETAALAEAFSYFRPRLLRMVQLRLDVRLRGRVDPSDVLQETYLDVVKGFEQYTEHEDFPFFLWLRLMTGRRLMNTHRDHLGAQKRDARRETGVGQGIPGTTSLSMADILVASWTSPSLAVRKAEMRGRLQQALEQMDPIDREVLTLRHLEELTNNETAHELGLSKAAASNRYVRALGRLRQALTGLEAELDSM